jgi:hypothetical protein
MRPPGDDEIYAFLERYGTASFPHAAEITSWLRDRDPSVKLHLHEHRLTRDSRAIWRVRAADRDVPSTYPATLLEDIRRLADALDAAPDQPCRHWHIALPDGTTYSVIELVADRRIAGAIKSADRRIVGGPDYWALMAKLGAKSQ